MINLHGKMIFWTIFKAKYKNLSLFAQWLLCVVCFLREYLNFNKAQTKYKKNSGATGILLKKKLADRLRFIGYAKGESRTWSESVKSR